MSIDVNNFPFTESLEKTLFSAFLQDRRLWVTMYQHIDPFYFKDKNLCNIFKILKIYFDKYKEFPTPDQIKSIAYKKEFDSAINKEIDDIYRDKNLIKQHEIDYLYDECNKFIKEQKIKKAILSSIELLEDNKFNEIEEIIKVAVQWNNDINIGTLLHEAEERYAGLEDLYEGAIEWPWKRLNVFSSPLFKKQLYSAVASSSVGKTIFLDNVGFYTWYKLKKNVVSVTFEISELKKGQRMDSYGLKIPIKELRDRKKEVFKFYEDNKLENRLFIKEFPTGGASINREVRSYLYNLEMYAGLHPKDIDLIIIDYLGIVKPTKSTGNMYQDGGSIAEEMRALAIEYDCPVLTADQLSRAVVKDNITVEELTEGVLSESFKKMMTVDFMIALINTPEERANGLINFKVLKDREGPKDTILPMRIDYPSLRIFDPLDN